MPSSFKVPIVNKCCYCIQDLKIASAMIALVGIITCPLVSWAVIRHSYVIRMSCTLTSNKTRMDVVDINIKNIISFGFGPNAGLGPSCLNKNIAASKFQALYFRASDDNAISGSIMEFVKYYGWFVLLVDVAFLGCAITFLILIFEGAEKKCILQFIIITGISILCSFIYGIMYITVCMVQGGAFPVFEVFFTIFDFTLWMYFLVVVNSFRRLGRRTQSPLQPANS